MPSNIEKLGFTEWKQLDIEELIALKEAQEVKKANAQVIDKFTGEIKRYRSMANPGNYHDATIITEESMTDTSNYEPIETTIEKCSRSGFLAEYMAREKLNDKESALDEDINDFSNLNPSPVDMSGFDLSQAKEMETEIINTIKEAQLNEASATTTSEPVSKETVSEPKATAE